MRLGILTGDDGWGTNHDPPAAAANMYQTNEILDHDRRYPECPGKSFTYGTWGGLVCNDCGR